MRRPAPRQQPARRRMANGTAIAAALVGLPFVAAFVFLAVMHHLSVLPGTAWSMAAALGIPALGVTAAAWSWRRLRRARQRPSPPGSGRSASGAAVAGQQRMPSSRPRRMAP